MFRHILKKSTLQNTIIQIPKRTVAYGVLTTPDLTKLNKDELALQVATLGEFGDVKHIGPTAQEIEEMLAVVNDKLLKNNNQEKTLTLEDLKKSYTVPENIKLSAEQIEQFKKTFSEVGSQVTGEFGVRKLFQSIAEKNNIPFTTLIGQGFSPSETPAVIQNNVLRNPSWNTAYTPYQAEISQGRLESLFNFQTMISELTGLKLANASLLDEATACAEAMSLCYSFFKSKKKIFLIDEKCHPQNIRVMQTRASLKGYETRVLSRDQFPEQYEQNPKKIMGCILQYPDTEGAIYNYQDLVEISHKNKALVAVSCDPCALTIFKTPGELGADIAVGTTQRFGIPLWLGGPHAAFMATKEENAKVGKMNLKRLIPARIVGKSKDDDGNPAFRLALQTREQHIKREKANSNVCTAQALLANGAAFYAIYHGPESLQSRARKLHRNAKILAKLLEKNNDKVTVIHNNFFDTLKIQCKSEEIRNEIIEKGLELNLNYRHYPDNFSLGIALHDLITGENVNNILKSFSIENEDINEHLDKKRDNYEFDYQNSAFLRSTDLMPQEIFRKYNSETKFSRYAKTLERKDLSLTEHMIPLGSCTMKLNSATSLDCMTIPGFANIHPLAPLDQFKGWTEILENLKVLLCECCGFDDFFLQPNSGAQGELAGMATIRNYHRANGEDEQRRIILIPTSAHGTNPASATMCGYTVKPIKVSNDGLIDTKSLDQLIEKFGNKIAGCMITYPSTYGIFESTIKETCEKIHAIGGQVYLDGANMNALLGIARPGDFGADVCHLNLHKTFSGPHGGGGPGAGPIGVKKHLVPFFCAFCAARGSNLKQR